MPYVERDHRGKIVSLYASPQEPIDGIPRTDPDPLPDDHPEVVAFQKEMDERRGGPLPTPAMPTLEELKRQIAEGERQRKEHEKIKTAVDAFNGIFSSIETSLSTLLYVTLNLRTSQVAYAIFFSPTSFDARAAIVNNAVIQIISENTDLADLLPHWASVCDNMNSIRNLRNVLAHGRQVTLHIENKAYPRFAPPAFDVIRLGRLIAKRKIPGFSSHDISAGVQRAQRLHDQINIVNRIMTDFFDGAPTWRKRCDVLRESLKAPHNQ